MRARRLTPTVANFINLPATNPYNFISAKLQSDELNILLNFIKLCYVATNVSVFDNLVDSGSAVLCLDE